MTTAYHPQDIFKYCFQAAFGAEHFVLNKENAQYHFNEEYEDTPASDIELEEVLSENASRINMGAWKKFGLPSEWLFNMFYYSINEEYIYFDEFEESHVKDKEEKKEAARHLYFKLVDEAEELTKQGAFPFSYEGFINYKKELLADGEPKPVRHSYEYREKEMPAYRVISKRKSRLIPILKAANGLENKIIAIDGRAGSGKSTMGVDLENILEAWVIKMDNFFLPKDYRTKERLEAPGGNIHYERFIDHVLKHLVAGENFDYEGYDCVAEDYLRAYSVYNYKWIVIEGSYSQHPNFNDYMGLRVFSDVEPDEQILRIKFRGSTAAKRFQDIWIPMEEKYFETFKIKEKSDLIV